MTRHSWTCLALILGASGAVTGSEPVGRGAGIRIDPAPPQAQTLQLVQRWHRENHRRIEPVLREWEILARATRERPGSDLAAGCRRLGSALGELGRTRLPPAPDPSISFHLEKTLRSLAEAAASCTHGSYFLTTWRLRQADGSWRQLQDRLRLYGLVP